MVLLDKRSELLNAINEDYVAGQRQDMTERIRWIVEDSITKPETRNGDDGGGREEIFRLIEGNLFGVHFQPIISTRNGGIYGYEALTRINGRHVFRDISELFAKAKETNAISSLDLLCRWNAMREGGLKGITRRGEYLFINVCPEILMDPDHRVGITDEMAEKCGIVKEKVILEITEETAIDNYRLFKDAIAYYRREGYKIAIDDFGSGHGGLKMLSIIEPDFVKIDRHFISYIDKAMIKYNLVESMATVCHRIGIKVIAEGVERPEELAILMGMDIGYLQGFLLGKPSPDMQHGKDAATAKALISRYAARRGDGLSAGSGMVGDICREVKPIPPTVPFSQVMHRFISDQELRGLPVVDGERVVGLLHRSRFMEEQILGRCGYGMHLNTHKNIDAVMERQFLMVEANAAIEKVSQGVNSRKAEFLYDDIVVTRHGKYAGIVAISDLLDAVTERSLIAAKDSNPLTGLPGNTLIRREIENRLSQRMHFDVCYIDLDNFKPFNDHYGFEKGDYVIKSLGSIAANVINNLFRDRFNFLGHIGGDDFILIARPRLSAEIAGKIIEDFSAMLPEFHGRQDFDEGGYVSRNRLGAPEEYGLLALSIGIVSSEVRRIDSFAQLASLASEVKKLAKMQAGSSIVRDRRMMDAEI
jgi:diguanylate cyclase (GGDEF)-like protein